MTEPETEGSANTGQFLIHLHNQLETYKELRDSITGLIFLGCPHSNSRRESLYESSVSVLQSAGLATKSTVAKRLSSRDDNDLLDICKEFDSASVRIEMLSVYEHVQTTWEKPRGVRDLRRSRQSAVVRSNVFAPYIQGPSDRRASLWMTDSP